MRGPRFFARSYWPKLRPKLPVLGYCFACEAERRPSDPYLLCAACFERVPTYYQACFYCSQNHPSATCPTKDDWSLAFGQAIFPYSPPISDWLIGFKYYQNLFAGRVLQRLVKDYWQAKRRIFPPYDLLVPMPSSFLTNLKRGYNVPSYLLLGLGQKIEPILRKSAHVQKQVGLNEAARKLNMENSQVFQLRQSVEGKRVLLFDDVVTTGATVQNASRFFYQKGAKQVSFFCLCRENIFLKAYAN